MPTKGQKAIDKEYASASPSLTLHAIKALLDEHCEKLSAELKSSFEAIDSKLDQNKLLLDDHDQRISSLELATDDLSQRVMDLENTCSSLREENAKLKAKAADLENRSRRQNVRILGLSEATESGNPTAFFSQLLQDLYRKEILPSFPEIVRAHRTLAPKPTTGKPLRPVILRLHRFQTKELLIREARRRGRFFYKGQHVRIVEDYSAEVASQRARYRDVMAGLYKQGLKPALLYPARLRITTPNGVRKWINTVEEAQKYIDEHPELSDHV
uniref:L1 transposable element RRM domain-containing protein n=1 Tax=Oryzias latipes TaxID=8090 RepID=A0A3B3I1G2_ORYLA